MKKRITLLLVFLLAASMVKVSAQEKSPITVKKSDVTNGVVIVTVLKAGKTYELMCNQGAPSCNPLKAGKYLMVELPSNSGMYECKDVEVYPETADGTDTDQKLGEYCLADK